jgi:beta-lactamase superfamily II metal-dependent hydrolase
VTTNPAPAWKIKIRMYSVGFGDCFLIRFKTSDAEHFVLVDCGVHAAQPGNIERMSGIVERVIGDVAALRGSARLDVVVGTHRHRDHVFGFEDPRWDTVEVGAVWMPWTEDPDDPVATDLRTRQSKRALNLNDVGATASGKRWGSVKKVLDNNLKNEAAMFTLHHGFAAGPEHYFLPEAPDRVSSIPFAQVLPGVRVHVLGPSRDERVIRDLTPPKDRTYLAGAPNTVVDSDTANLPDFDAFEVDQTAYSSQHPGLVTKFNSGPIVTASRRDPLSLAVALEQAVNGTSLVLAFEFAGHVLIFPGDAQWGTWEQAMNDPVSQELLKRTTVLKVGHHGSHNATPKRLLEEFISGAQAALIPVTTGVFPDIPRQPLLDELASGRRFSEVLRSDQPPVASPDIETDPHGWWTELTLHATY